MILRPHMYVSTSDPSLGQLCAWQSKKFYFHSHTGKKMKLHSKFSKLKKSRAYVPVQSLEH